MDELIVPLQEKKSLIDKIKAHKIPVILGSIAFLILFSLILYLVSPFRDAMFSPAEDENLLTPNTQTTRTPSKIPLKPASIASPTPHTLIASWLTYTNSLYNYRIQYPSDWIARDLGQLEPKIPSYIVFNSNTATTSARYITVSVSTRTYAEQLALAASGSAVTVAGLSGTKQSFQDSDGNTSTVITLPRDGNLLVLRAKTANLSIFDLMLTSLEVY